MIHRYFRHDKLQLIAAACASPTFIVFIYPLIFLLMFIEGGDATLLATGFLIRLGYLNFFLVFPALILAAFSRDIILYKIGKRYGDKFVEKFGKYLFITPAYFQKIKKRLEKTRGKTIFISKFVYGINHITIIAVGATKMDFRRFLKIDFATILIWEAILLGLGFFLGHSFQLAKHIIKDVGLFLTFALLAFLLLETAFRKFIKFNGNNEPQN